MLLTTTEINNRYLQGIGYITNITFNKLLKDQHAVQYKNTSQDNKLLLLLYAVDSWDNRPGADNWLTQSQIMAIMDNIGYGHRDSLSGITTTSSAADCGCNESSGTALSVEDTASVNLTYVNGKLKADIKVSAYTGNGFSVKTDGAFSEQSSGTGGTTTKIFLTADDFETGTNIYNNVALAGKSNLAVWYRGVGFLLYNFNNPSDPINEYTILSGGGIEITIPGFDVHSGDNYFYIES